MSAESPVAASLKLGRYVLERRIASGGMADVYLARQIGAFGFAKNVAVKVLKSDISGDADHVRMFLREAMVAAEFKHPNLVQVYEVGEEGGRLYLAMELVRGISLATIMQNLATRKRSIPIPLATKIARDALEGMAHAAEAVNAEGQPLKLVHRDLSPQNILVDVSGVVKVVDFGIARAETRAGRTQGAQIKGKFGYMAPEQWNASADIDARADLFSLAVVLYETSTGSRKLFRGQSAPELYRAILKDPIQPPTARVAEYPENLSDVIMRGLERDVNDRYPSALAMRDALDEVMRENRWNVTSEDLARLVAMSLDGQSIEERWERIAAGQIEAPGDGDDVAAAVAALNASRAPMRAGANLSGPYPAITPGDGAPAGLSSATVSARPTSLGLNPTSPSQPDDTSPTIPSPEPTPVPPPIPSLPEGLALRDGARRSEDAHGDGAKLPSVRAASAMAGWLVALAIGVTWWRTRERLDAIIGNAPVAVAPAPPAERVLPAPLVLLSDATLAEGVGAPWAEILQTESRGMRVTVDRGDALTRLIQGEALLALRVGFADPSQITAGRAQGFELRSPACERVVGFDHAVVVVNPSNPLPSLDATQLAGLFSGRTASYHALHGTRGAPKLVTCGVGAPTRAFLDDLVATSAGSHGPRSVSPEVEVVVDEAAAVRRVAGDPLAIALVRLAWVSPSVRVVPIRAQGAREGVTPTRDAIRAGTYPLVRPVVLYARVAPIGAAVAMRIADVSRGADAAGARGHVSR
ncbi:MAG: serine/threonine-protein kinase [Polyangiales bacterium]